MYTFMMILVVLASVVSLVFFVVVLIKIFQDSVGLGILGLFIPIFTFIYGWVKSKEYGIKKTMLLWTAAIVTGIILQTAAAAFMTNNAVNSTRDLQRQLLLQQQQFRR